MTTLENNMHDLRLTFDCNMYRVKPSWAEQVEQGDDAGTFNHYLQLHEQAQNFCKVCC